MLVHPDRCALPSAEGAFAAASQAVDLLKARAEELERQPLLEALAAEGGAGTLGGGGGATAGGGGAGAGGGDGALVRFVDAEELLQSVSGGAQARHVRQHEQLVSSAERAVLGGHRVSTTFRVRTLCHSQLSPRCPRCLHRVFGTRTGWRSAP